MNGRAGAFRSYAGATIALAALLALILVPFLLWGDAIETWVRNTLSTRGAAAIAVLGGGLLALDVVLPVPSSVLGILLGASLGFAAGTVVGTVGLTLGCLLGYGIGARSGFRTWGGVVEGSVTSALRRHGVLALAVLRPVPVLAEASVVVAGALGLPFRRVLVVTAAANLPISAAYAAIGASLTPGAPWIALATLLCGGLVLRSVRRAR